MIFEKKFHLKIPEFKSDAFPGDASNTYADLDNIGGLTSHQYINRCSSFLIYVLGMETTIKQKGTFPGDHI